MVSLNVFSEFPRWDGDIPPGYTADFLGHLTDNKFFNDEGPHQNFRRDTSEQTPNEETFEWLALLESVLAARDTFTMIEAGAGYGRWTARAWHACKMRGLKPTLIAIEAEPTHFAFMQRHFEYNGVDPSCVTLINAALVTEGNSAHFTVGHPTEWYGQAVVKPGESFGNWSQAQVEEVAAVTLNEILAQHERIDFIDMDIQGMEGEIIPRVIDDLTKKVREAFIATHSLKVGAAVEKAFLVRLWSRVATFRPLETQQTSLGKIEFQDGVQWWKNKNLTRSEF